MSSQPPTHRRARSALALPAAFLALNAAGCNDEGGVTPAGGTPSECAVQLAPGGDDQAAVQTALIEARPGTTVCFAAGTFSFTTELSLDVERVTLAGAGQGMTILDFSNQDTGANGLVLRADGAIVRDLDVRNTPGDGIRADSVAGVTFERVSVIWDADASMENGAYGLYPVNSTDVVIGACVVKGARDAGIYVGQSERILVQGSEAYGNVAGIEIENSTDAIVRNNHSHDNTGGLLVFNLPDLPVQDGKRANVYDNVIENNNGPNFGEPGTIISVLPPGLGIMILAADDNEIHNNEIRGNQSVAVVLLSYDEGGLGPVSDPNYDFFTQGNFIHDNVYEGNGTDPLPFFSDYTAIRPMPDIVWDGCTDPDAVDDGRLTNCLSEPGATYVNFNRCGELPGESQDLTPVTCTYEPLPSEP
jgi:parallel beta-helix repeat protein